MTNLAHTDDDIIERIEAAGERMKRVHQAAASVIFGQDVVIERTLVTLLAGGHALLIGVPGLAKTLLVETLGKVLGLEAKRIQFTPDLMPSDIIGSEVLEDNPGQRRSFRFIPGPIFTQHPARGRNQPNATQDAVGPAAGDAGASRDGGRAAA
jgi:MoxR-like ATPase